MDDPLWEKFRGNADRLIKRLHAEAKLLPLRIVLKGLLITIEPMNPGDCAELVIGEDAAQRDALRHLERLGCLTVLQTNGDTVGFELFSKRQLAYVAEKVDAALRSHDRKT
jgi:hypothetical protein